MLQTDRSSFGWFLAAASARSFHHFIYRFLLVQLIQTAAGNVSPGWHRPATFIYSCDTITLFCMLCRQQARRVEESTVLKHRKCISQNNFGQPFLVCGKYGKMAVAAPVSDGFEGCCCSPVVRSASVKTLICKNGSGCFCFWLIKNIWYRLLPVTAFFFFLLPCLTHGFYVELFSNKHQVWTCEQLLKFIWQCYSRLSSNQLGCIWPWPGLLCNTVCAC